MLSKSVLQYSMAKVLQNCYISNTGELMTQNLPKLKCSVEYYVYKKKIKSLLILFTCLFIKFKSIYSRPEPHVNLLYTNYLTGTTSVTS